MLGVKAGASARELRTAYRRLVRRHHPDVAGPEGTHRAVRVIEAYGVLTGAQAPRAARPASSSPRNAAGTTRTAPPPPPPPAAPHGDDTVPDDTVPLAAPTVEVFEQLCEAADVLGDVSYVDASCGILETIVHWDGWPHCSLLITLQQRGNDTLAQCTLESLTSNPGPPIEHVVRELRSIMTALAE